MANQECRASGGRIRRVLMRFGVVAILGVGLVAGYTLRGCAGSDHAPGPAAATTADAASQAQTYTCSMHPQIRQPKPGLCPICGMDLIPVATDHGEDLGPRRFATSESAKALMDIQTVRVERRFAEAKIRLVGKVDYDETRLATISAWVPGRLDRMFVDYTGMQVRKGDHLVSLYSPDLLTAQQELRTAAEALARVSSTAPQVLRDAGATLVSGAKEKLARWGLTEAQIRAAESSGVLSDHVTVYAPIGGTVIERNGVEGMYVATGEMIYRIADLSKVWVTLEAYESDLAWLHYGQTVLFSAQAYPGQTFEGQIAFIDPLLNPRTRTVRLRVNADNQDGRLKPEMFVRAVVQAKVATSGRVMDPALAGKWISPMHPEIVKDGPGTCDICGMALVRAEELGYVPAVAKDEDIPLVIPASAPLITGKRAVVYVEVPETDRPTFEGREVVLGPRAGDFYLVESGLEEGDMVVTNGNFKIDSALQILAKPSMMNPESKEETPHADPEEAAEPRAELTAPATFSAQLRAVVEAYYPVRKALAADSAPDAAKGVAALGDALGKVDMALLEGDAHVEWMARLKTLEQGIAALKEAGTDIEKQRGAFETISTALIQAADQLGLGPGPAAHVVHCPMAFDNKGADWLQPDKEVRNPYFGSAMLNCGSVTRTIGAAEGAGGHEHD